MTVLSLYFQTVERIHFRIAVRANFNTTYQEYIATSTNLFLAYIFRLLSHHNLHIPKIKLGLTFVEYSKLEYHRTNQNKNTSLRGKGGLSLSHGTKANFTCLILFLN